MALKYFLLVILLVCIYQVVGYGLGCSPSRGNQDCEHPDTHVCTKILLGTTPAEKAKGKYYYTCLPASWAQSAVKVAEGHGPKVLESARLESHPNVQEEKPQELKLQEVKPQETAKAEEVKPQAVKPQQASIEAGQSLDDDNVADPEDDSQDDIQSFPQETEDILEDDW